MVDSTPPLSPDRLPQVPPPPAKGHTPTEDSSFSKTQGASGSMVSLFAKLSKGDQKLAKQMLDQTFHLATTMIMSQMNHFVQTMRQQKQDVL